MWPCTEPAITDTQIASNSSWMVWQQRQSIATRIPVQPLSTEQPLLARLTLASDSIYANLGSGGFGSCVRYVEKPCHWSAGCDGRPEIVGAGSPAQ